MGNVYINKGKFIIENQELKTDLPYSENISILANEYKIGNKTISNRLICQAMEGCDGTADGSPGILTKRRYEHFAEGGAGLIWFETTAVMKEALKK